MPCRARRVLSRLCRGSARRAWLAIGIWLAAAGPGPADGTRIVEAAYGTPTTRYAHGVLGDAVEWGSLALRMSDGRRATFVLPDTHVFEDIAPRLTDLDGDGAPEVIVIETSLSKGARLSVYGPEGLLAATPYIGTAHRWLAPVGATDLDGDGVVEIAYVDRPHLAKVLRIWRYQAGVLTHVTDASDLTNHKIGWDFIAGGIRACGQRPEMILATGNWAGIVAATLIDGAIDMNPIGPYAGPDSLTAALACP